MTRVVANAASARVGGGLSYIVRQLSALERVRPDLDLEVLAAPWNAEALTAALDSPVTTMKVPNAGARFAYEQLVVPRRTGRDRILYCPGNFIPLLPGGPPSVLTLQNPNYVGAGPAFPANGRWNRRAKITLSRWSLRRADRVVVISESLADELRRDLPHLAERVTVITSGAPVWDQPSRRPSGFSPSGGYVLSLANDYAHKHLDHLVDAWATAFAERAGPALVLVGDVTAERRSAQLRRVPGPARDRLVHLGSVADRGEVRWLLEHAVAMAAPSALEAYPLTPAEAGAVGCPVVLSDIAPHREVAGGHARYVPVGDRAALAAALAASFDDPPPRDRWGLEQSWDDNATELGRVFDELIDQRVPS